MNHTLKSLICTAALAAVAMPAAADVITFAGAGTTIGNGAPAQMVDVSAEAVFNITGDLLTITLRNTSGPNNKVDTARSTLTGMFWDSLSDRTLTTVSARLAAGSTIYQADKCSSNLCDSATDLSGEFGYEARGFTGGADRGIASSLYLQTGLRNNIGNFNNGQAGPDLDNPVNIDGINFGIISKAGFNPGNGLANVPLVLDAAVFTLKGMAGLTTADIAHVSFQFGTTIDEYNLAATPVPEPLTGALLGLGLLGMAAARRRRA